MVGTLKLGLPMKNMKRLLAVITLLMGVVAFAQTSQDGRWFDSDPNNDPDGKNHCFIYFDCKTEAHWKKGWEIVHYGSGFGPLPPTRIAASYGDPNLCWSVWTCKGDAEWQRGLERGRQIYPPKAAPSPTPTRTKVPKRAVSSESKARDDRMECTIWTLKLGLPTKNEHGEYVCWWTLYGRG